MLHSNKQKDMKTPKNIIEIPRIAISAYSQNQENYYQNSNIYYGSCACCGKGIKEPKLFINTIFGGEMYPANDSNEYDDAWQMPIGKECAKKIPTEYLIKTGL